MALPTYVMILLNKSQLTSWIYNLFLWIMAPGYANDRTVYPTATRRPATILVAMRTYLAIWIVFSSTSHNISLTKPCFTRMAIIWLRATIWTFWIARAIYCAFIMFYPTTSHALRIMTTTADAFINKSVTDVFAFQFIFWIPENAFDIAVRDRRHSTDRS